MEENPSVFRISTLILTDIDKRRLWKVTLIFLFLLLNISILITWNSPAVGYESSIYQSTPFIFWAGVITSFISGITIVIISIVKNDLNRNSLWKVGFVLILLSYSICLSLFIIRGYFMWGVTGDPGSHIGWAKEILNVGHASNSLVYPITHIYLSEIVFFSGLDLIFLHKILPLIFELLCILFMYIFAKNLFPNSNYSLLVGILSCCLTFGCYLYLTPNGLANLLIPFVFIVIIKIYEKRNWTWTIILSIIFIFYTVFHPIPAFILGLVFLTLWITIKIPYIITDLKEKKKSILKHYSDDLQLLFPLLILVIWYIFWITHFWVFGRTVWDIYQTISLEDKATEGTILIDRISYMQGFGYSVIEIFLKRFGAKIILLLLSLLSFPLLWKEFTKKGGNKIFFSFYGPSCVIFILMCFLFILDLPFDPFRLTFYLAIIGTIYLAFFLLNFLKDKTPKKNSLLDKSYFRVSCVTALISLLFLTSVSILYPSSYILISPPHNTKSEIIGMTFFYTHRDIQVPLTGITIAPRRLSHLLLTPEEQNNQPLPLNIYNTNNQVPLHFGYDRFSSLSFNYTDERDMIITKRDKLRYLEIFPNLAKYEYNNEDFLRLNDDPGVDFIYSNDGITYWKIRPITKNIFSNKILP